MLEHDHMHMIMNSKRPLLHFIAKLTSIGNVASVGIGRSIVGVRVTIIVVI